MKIKLISFILLVFSLNCDSQKISLNNLLPYLGYPNFQLGMTFEEFKHIVEFPLPCMSIGFNQTFRLNEEFASKFLDFSCVSYYSFNTKNLLALESWEIDLNSENQDSTNNILSNEISKLLGKPNLDTTFNDPLEVRKVLWSQDGLTLRLYYRKERGMSFIDLSSAKVRSNDFGVSYSITSFFKQKRISYKFEKEHQGETLFDGRIVQSAVVDYSRKVNTIFVFITGKNGVTDKLRIGDKLFKISSIDTYRFNAEDDKGRFCTINFFADKGESQILIEYGNNNIRYYFKNN